MLPHYSRVVTYLTIPNDIIKGYIFVTNDY